MSIRIACIRIMGIIVDAFITNIRLMGDYHRLGRCGAEWRAQRLNGICMSSHHTLSMFTIIGITYPTGAMIVLGVAE